MKRIKIKANFKRLTYALKKTKNNIFNYMDETKSEELHVTLSLTLLK